MDLRLSCPKSSILPCNDMETLSTLLALYEESPLITEGFSSQVASNAELWCFLSWSLYDEKDYWTGSKIVDDVRRHSQTIWPMLCTSRLLFFPNCAKYLSKVVKLKVLFSESSWRHQMEIFSVLLYPCAGNPGGLSSHRDSDAGF